uniref:Uncharacterized protein n=1 Tax=Anguilla anguilla TaxID=7936 RepID=A0A0E9TN62_ANGAN
MPGLCSAWSTQQCILFSCGLVLIYYSWR